MTAEQELPESDGPILNASTEPTFGDLLARRGFLQSMLGTAAAAGIGSALPGAAQAAAGKGGGLTFKEVAHGPTEDHAVAPGYSARVLIRWGDPLFADAPRFDPRNQTAAAQARQFGYNNDFQAFMPLPRGSKNAEHGLLWLNHEYTQAGMMFPMPDPKAALPRELVDVEIAAHGGSVVEVVKRNGRWQVVLGALNRRITADTPMRLTGPAAGSPRLRTNADPSGTMVRGMINNCAGGVTPWGTILTCEENIHYYFNGAVDGPEAANHKRYGISGKGRNAWGRFHDRFNLDREPNAANSYGWVVEIDPYDPTSTPVKHTALGRFKRECACTTLDPHGHVVVYSGDDERFEYLYKFVSRGRYDVRDRAANMRLLDDGTLYVAKFSDDGTLAWLPMVHGQGPLTEANGFASQADVVIQARTAGDLLGATPMDRPEDIEMSPVTGKVYVALTNNGSRKPDQVNKVNPRANNLYGHIVEIVPAMVGGVQDHGAATAGWTLFLAGGNPNRPEDKAQYGGPLSPSGWLACPDNLAFDSRGRLWISTDQGNEQHKYGIGDGIWACETEGPGRAVTRMFYRTPRGAEMCGPCFTPDDRTFFVAVQHPGTDDPGTSYATPSTRWPDFKPDMPPRPSVVVITKNDGGVIGG